MGRECLNLKNFKTEKTRKLSLTNTERRDESGFHDMVANPEDSLCIVRIFKALRAHYPANFTGTILRRSLPEKERKKLRKSLGRGAFLPMADLAEKGRFGKNYTTTVCRRVALRCSFDRPEKHTAAGRRRAGITDLVSSTVEVPSSELLIASRHKSILMSAKYQASNENAHAKRYEATMYNDEVNEGTVLYCVLLCFLLLILIFFVLQMPFFLTRNQLRVLLQLLKLRLFFLNRPSIPQLCLRVLLCCILLCSNPCILKLCPHRNLCTSTVFTRRNLCTSTVFTRKPCTSTRKL